MNRQKTVLFAATLALIGGAAALLAQLHAHQRLGPPAVRTSSITNSIRLHVDLPEFVGAFTSAEKPIDQLVLDTLPKDTSFGQRCYVATNDGFWSMANVVLMGTDRTSLHKPVFCLEGQGWHIDENASSATAVHVEKPYAYDLPVMKFVASRVLKLNEQEVFYRGVYVYWFVAPGQLTANHWQRMWWMARDLFRSGLLQRWAYVSYFSICRPGEENITFERMKKLIAVSVPEFQLMPEPIRKTASLPN
jgi:hypothetical protein